MLSQFKKAMETKPTGIAVMGICDDAFKELIAMAEKNGVIVTSQNTRCECGGKI